MTLTVKLTKSVCSLSPVLHVQVAMSLAWNAELLVSESYPSSDTFNCSIYIHCTINLNTLTMTPLPTGDPSNEDRLSLTVCAHSNYAKPQRDCFGFEESDIALNTCHSWMHIIYHHQ